MKLTKEKLKSLIKDVILENREKSMLLTEGDKKSKYQKVLDLLGGKIDTVNTVGIMSGQNPMVKNVHPRLNKIRKTELEQLVQSMGLPFIRIGAVFGNLPEQSMIILDPTESQMDQLCRNFQQWGFVWGEKAFPGAGEDHQFMIFSMQVIDYENEMGWHKDPDSKVTAMVIEDSALAGVKTDFSYDPTSKKKFNLPLYEEE